MARAPQDVTVHHLYIFTYDNPDKKAEDANMLSLLEFIDNNINTINDMKIKIEIHKYTQRQLISNEPLRVQIAKDQIYFPMIRTPNKTYTGFEDIQRLYQTNILAFRKFEKKVEKQASTGADDVEDYMRAAITSRDEEEDDENAESLSGGKGLSAQVSAAMAARNSKNPQKPIRGVAPQREPDNVKPNRESFQQTITRLRNPQQTETGGIRGGGITEDDQGDGDSFKDDAMLKAAAARDEDSLKSIEADD